MKKTLVALTSFLFIGCSSVSGSRNSLYNLHDADKSRLTFPIRVNYDLSVESLVLNGWYIWKDTRITTENFPSIRKGEVDLVIELVHFDKVLAPDEVLMELDVMGYRPAEILELLAFGEKYPEIPKRFPVVAHGSVWRDWHGHNRVPYLDRYGTDLNSFDEKWDKRFRFAAVRK